jgi:hypothetical protein
MLIGEVQEGRAVLNVITLGRVLEYLNTYVRRRWEVVRQPPSKDPALGMLILLEKFRHVAGARHQVAPVAELLTSPGG